MFFSYEECFFSYEQCSIFDEQCFIFYELFFFLVNKVLFSMGKHFGKAWNLSSERWKYFTEKPPDLFGQHGDNFNNSAGVNKYILVFIDYLTRF